MGKHLRKWWGLTKQSDYVRKYIHASNMRAALYMSSIVICLEVWMVLSLVQSISDSAAAGKPRDFAWIVSHGAWYVVLIAIAIVVLVHAIRYMQGKIHGTRVGNVLLVVFSVACLVFGVHFGNNSYVQGDQILAYVTMVLFVFGLLIWKPIPSTVASIVTFGGFFLYIDHNLPTNYSLQVNLFTLWISTAVVALAAYHQKVSEASQGEQVERANARLKQANEHLRRIATHDMLTGIPNMHAFIGAVGVLFEGIEEFDVKYSILYMDVENFKAYNDKHGFGAGDALLHDIGQGLREIFAEEIVARYSDDHFVALCEAEVAHERASAAYELVHKLRGDIRLRLKTGIYNPVMEQNMDVNQACDKARHACNQLKRRPNVYVGTYDNALDTEVRQRQHVINNVKRAVSEGWIKVYYQPVVRCADGSAELCGYEALARWIDPEFGFMPPFAFIETLEEFREIDKLDRCIIEQVCRDLRAELDAGHDVVPVSLNFSRLDFELYDVPDFLHQMTHKYDIPANLLDVEITESALSEQFNELQRSMSKLRDSDYSLWLDDFGSGYSSLNVLKDFQFNVLKIDMAFLRNFGDNDNSRPILRHIVELAHELGMVTLCEGVETREQFEFLSSIGCDRAQGYHFGKPDAQKQHPAAA